jgi:hypothetical protein
MADTGGMTRFQTSWAIAKRSWAVLKSDKSLAWFPVLSFLASLVVFGVFGGLFAALGFDGGKNEAVAPAGYVLVAVLYLCLAFVQTYFLAGLVAGADERLRGGHSTVRTALDVANSRLHRLLPWAIVSATVSLVLSLLEQQGWIGRVVASLLGLAWNLVTFLTIPILVIEDIRVGAALTRSKDLFKRTWGENVVGQAGLGIVGFVAMLPGLLVIALGAATGSVVVAVAIGVIGVAWILASMIVVAALSGIYRTALYRFASTGEIPADFSGIDFQGAFRPRGENRTGFGDFGGTAGFNPN